MITRRTLLAQISQQVDRNPNWVPAIRWHEKRIHSQNGEDGIIQYIFDTIGITNKFYVEFGCDGGTQCNARYLHERKGWRGLQMDSDEWGNDNIKCEMVTAENVNHLFRKYRVPFCPDLLSIDIDGNDFWVWKACHYRPRLLINDYNGLYVPPISKTIQYDPVFKWNGNDYATATLAAFVKLNQQKGYTLVYCDIMGVNAFFIRNDILKRDKVPEWQSLWRPLLIPPRDPHHDRRPWIEI